MKKFLTICAVVMAMASVASASFVDTVGDTITFDGVVNLDFVNWNDGSTAIEYAATQEGTLTTTEAGFADHTLVISSTTSGTAGALDVDISWLILNGAAETVLEGTMENFGFADSSGVRIAGVPSGESGSGIYTLADYATTGLWQAEGFSSGAWVGTYESQPVWTGTVAITPSAVPEPATMCLLGLGGVMSLISRKRKRA